MAVFATVLALAACGTQVEEDRSISIGPTAPTEDTDSPEDADASDADVTAPIATPPAATDALSSAGAGEGPEAGAGSDTSDGAVATGPVSTGTAGGTGVAGPAATTTEGTAGETGGGEAPSALPEFAAPGELLVREPTGAVHLMLDDVRVGLQDGYDRVVLDLSGTGEVGWSVQYVETPALDGSGIPVDLVGPAVLVVSARGMAYPEPGDPAYDDGVLLVDGGDLQVVTEVLRDVPFEGQLQVFVGAGAEAPFRVFRLDSPERLVIDIQH